MVLTAPQQVRFAISKQLDLAARGTTVRNQKVSDTVLIISSSFVVTTTLSWMMM
jgi:hypothetical protein